MWFKNCQVFSLKEKFNYDPEGLHKKLEDQAFQPCSSVEPLSMGWTQPILKDDAPLVYGAAGFLLLALKTEQKLIPSSVLNERLGDKMAEIEAKEGRKVRKKEKDTLKDEILHTMITQAFSQTSTLYAYIDTLHDVLVVNTPSRKKAEQFCSHLRQSLGSLKVELPDVDSISVQLTDWLKSNEYPAELVIEENCVIEDSREGGSIKLSKQDLLSDEVKRLLEHGREIMQMSLSWRDEVGFTLKDDFSIKSIKFLEGVQDRASDLFTETEAERFDADFTIMAETLRELTGFLLKTFKRQAGSEKKAAEAEEVLA